MHLSPKAWAGLGAGDVESRTSVARVSPFPFRFSRFPPTFRHSPQPQPTPTPHLRAQVSYMILSRVSPVTHSIGNCVKRVVVIAASVLFFRNPVSLQNALGESLRQRTRQGGALPAAPWHWDAVLCVGVYVGV